MVFEGLRDDSMAKKAQYCLAARGLLAAARAILYVNIDIPLLHSARPMQVPGETDHITPANAFIAPTPADMSSVERSVSVYSALASAKFPGDIHLGRLVLDLGAPHTSPTWLRDGLSLREVPQLLSKFGHGIRAFICILPYLAVDRDCIDDLLTSSRLHHTVHIEACSARPSHLALDARIVLSMRLRAFGDPNSELEVCLSDEPYSEAARVQGEGRISIAGDTTLISGILSRYSSRISMVTYRYQAGDVTAALDQLLTACPDLSDFEIDFLFTPSEIDMYQIWQAIGSQRSHLQVAFRPVRASRPSSLLASAIVGPGSSISGLELHWYDLCPDVGSMQSVRSAEKEIEQFCRGEASWDATQRQFSEAGVRLLASMEMPDGEVVTTSNYDDFA